MRELSVWVALALLLASTAGAGDAPALRKSTPQIHNSACSLAESMASKLGSGKATQDMARQSCQALAPTMSDADHAEFMRCCISRLVTGAPAGKAAPKSHKPASGTQQM